MLDPAFIARLAKEAALAEFRATTSRSRTVKADSESGRREAQRAMSLDPPANAQGHSPTRYGRKVKR